jgi:hypothetical protein
VAQGTQVMDVVIDWGPLLTSHKRDLLVSEIEHPDNFWIVDPVILMKAISVSGRAIASKKQSRYWCR